MNKLTRPQRRLLAKTILADMKKRGPVERLNCGCYRGTCPGCGQPTLFLNLATGEARCTVPALRLSLN